MKLFSINRAARGRALAVAVAAMGVATLAGCGGGGGGGGFNSPTPPALPALNGQAINNPFGLDGQAFSLTLGTPASQAGRPRVVAIGNTTFTEGFSNYATIPNTVTVQDIKIALTLKPSVTLTLPAGSTYVLPNSISVNSLSADNIQVTKVNATGQATGTPVPVPSITLANSPVVLTKQADNSYVPTAGTSLTLNDLISGSALQQLTSLLTSTSAAQNGISFTVNANVTAVGGSADLPDGTKFNAAFGSSSLTPDVTTTTGGGGGGNPTPGNAGTFAATFSNPGLDAGGNAYNGTAITSTPVNFGFSTTVDSVPTATRLTGTGQDATGVRNIGVLIAGTSTNLTSGQVYGLTTTGSSSVKYAEGTTKVWTSSAGNITLDTFSSTSKTGDLVSVFSTTVPTGGATMIPDASVTGNTAQGTFTLRLTNPSSP